MFVLDIILMIVGVAFFTLGYLICFRKHFKLISGFESNYKKGICDESYAIQTGMILVMAGVVYVFCGMTALIVSKAVFSIAILLICILLTSLALIYNNIKSLKKPAETNKVSKIRANIVSCNG